MAAYSSLAELVNAAKAGEFNGTVTVDNDAVHAYPDATDENDDPDCAYHFNDNGPEDALIEALNLLGLQATRA